MMTVYLAGPIEGRSPAEAGAWRQRAAAALWRANIYSLSPTRGNPDLVISAAGDPQRSREGILARDWFDVQRADALLVNLIDPSPDTPSYGTIMEIGWAWALRKPVVAAVRADHPLLRHPLVGGALGPFKYRTLGEAVDGLIILLGGAG